MRIKLVQAAKFIIFVAFFFALAELLLHSLIYVYYSSVQFDDNFHHIYIPHLNRTDRFSNYTSDLVINSNGFRSAEYNYSKQNNTKRIMVIGDSMTVNNAVPSDKMYTTLLSNDLNNNSSSRWEVINRGVEAWGTDNEYLYYVKEGYKYNPDILILQFTIANDFLDTTQNNMTYIENGTMIIKEKYMQPTTLEQIKLFLNQKSGVYRIFASFTAPFYVNIVNRENYTTYGTINYIKTTENIFSRTVFLLDKLNEYSAKNGTKFLIVIVDDSRGINKQFYNYWNGVHKNYISQKEMSRPRMMLIEYLNYKNISYIDTSSVVTEFDDYVSLYDGHFSIKGSEKVGNFIYSELKRIGIV